MQKFKDALREEQKRLEEIIAKAKKKRMSICRKAISEYQSTKTDAAIIIVYMIEMASIYRKEI